MSDSLLWIHKNAISDQLSQSSRREESKIRQHVQLTQLSRELSKANDDNGSPITGAFSRLDFRKKRATVRKPKTLQATRSEDYDDETPLLAALVRSALPTGTSNLSRSERRSLQFFVLRSSQECSGWADLPFWNGIALQLSQSSQIVAHSLVSLSSLHESMTVRPDTSFATQTRLFSTMQGAKASQAATTSDMTYLEALTSCIILYCFYGLQNATDSARLLRSGINMLAAYDRSKTRLPSNERLAIEVEIRPIFEHLLCRPCRMSDPAIAFAKSILRQRSHVSKQGAHDQLKPQKVIGFDKPEEARNSLQEILTWAHDNIPLSNEDADKLASFHQVFCQFCASWQCAVENMEDVPRYQSEFNSARTVLLLRIAFLFGRVLVETFPGEDEMIYDEYLPDFREIIQFAERLVVDDNRKCIPSFGIDGGLVDIIAFVGCKCRDPGVRRRAASLLLHGGWLEGDRLSFIPGMILECLIDLEEIAGAKSCRDVAAVNRRRLVCGHHFRGRFIRLFFTSTLPSVASDAAFDERYIYMPNTGRHDSLLCSDGINPDAIFGPDYAAFLQDRETQSYYRLPTTSFRFPIPRV